MFSKRHIFFHIANYIFTPKDGFERKFRENNFDLIRLFAAVQVLLVHSLHRLDIEINEIASYIVHLFPGVPIFFVLSGYLVSASYERNPSYYTYMRSRALRIFPGLWGCLLLTFITLLFFGFDVLNMRSLAWLVLQGVGAIYTPNNIADFGMGSYNGSLWTIPIELQFYVVMPVLYLISMFFTGRTKYFIFVFFSFLVLAVALKWLLPGMGDENETILEKLLRYSFVPHFYMFCLGIVFQKVKIHEIPFVINKAVVWILLYFVFRLFAPANPVSEVISSTLAGFCVMSVAYSLPTVSNKILKHQDISYGVYIYHGLVINVLLEFGFMNSEYLIFVVLLASCVLGFLSWRLIEKPALRVKAAAKQQETILPNSPTPSLKPSQ